MYCEECGELFSLTQEDLEAARRFDFQPNALCFACSQRQRLAFRGERSLHRRTCDLSGEAIISVYSEDKKFPVYKSDYWFSDRWDALCYGRAYNFQRPFFEQFAELQHLVPRVALSNVRGENSDYCHSTVGNKNCYLLFGGDENEDCMYGSLCMRNMMTHDVDYGNRNSWCYMLSDSSGCYSCQFAFDCKDCSDCYYASDCIGCNECILCTSLVKKSYCILNKQYSKQEYFSKKKELIYGSFRKQEELVQQFLQLLQERVVKYAHIIGCENCTGDYLLNSKNCWRSFNVTESEDLSDIIFGGKSKNCFNSSMLGDNSENCYNSVSTFAASNVRSSFFVIHSNSIDYSDMCIDSQDLFGCVGLRKKQYCILNQQYSRDDYFALKARIETQMKETSEWGRYFPKELSCFDFNESSGQRYFPLSAEEARGKGFSWRKEVAPLSKGESYVVPDVIAQVEANIVDQTLTCRTCTKRFKILLPEFRFYKKLEIPVPHDCPDCRHAFRRSLRNPATLWEGSCARCGTAFETSYAPERPETVVCEGCYATEFLT